MARRSVCFSTFCTRFWVRERAYVPDVTQKFSCGWLEQRG